MYDENDGWFDQVPPPTAPVGTPGEYLTASPSSTLEPDAATDDLGVTGPLGLGVRVPCGCDLALQPGRPTTGWLGLPGSAVHYVTVTI